MSFDHRKIEPKWQAVWGDEKIGAADDTSTAEKFFVLVEFPYPSGDGLHVGHCRSYTALDVIARQKRMEGRNVLFPIGFDAFGLPTENYALKNKIHPRAATEKNIANFTRQLKSLGFSFDWERVIDTTDPAYYRWTQFIFLKFLEKGLAYQKEMPINWCESCRIGLANEEVVSGKCERCGTTVERRRKKQWMLAITEYADRLLKDLETVDFLPRIKLQQQNWIGKSSGAEVDFTIPCDCCPDRPHGPIGCTEDAKIKVFTTRPDTLFGATYLVLAPEHELVEKLKPKIQNWAKIEKYRAAAAKKSDFERGELQKEKTGVALQGVTATNPISGEAIPIWIADYVLVSYGTGAIMAVPAHDERDFEFAQKFGLEIKYVVCPGTGLIQTRSGFTSEFFNFEPNFVTKKENHKRLTKWLEQKNQPYIGEYGYLINSGKFDKFFVKDAKEKIITQLKEIGAGKATINFKLRDWVFSRQRYWGEPIPVVHCEKCGVVPLDEKDLPLELPAVKNYEPTETGESPLAAMEEWVRTSCPKCGGAARRETDTMPNWAGSSWYFLRYCDPHNDREFADFKKLKKWLPVDLYNGGMEHTVLHLLYSRFWHKFLFDQKLVPTAEPFAKRISHGMILGPDGEKMSKSRGNVIGPDEIVQKWGADTLRIYELFIGPFDQAVSWDDGGVIGVRRFLEKVWRLLEKPFDKIRKDGTCETEMRTDVRRLIHQTVKKVSADLEKQHFNTAVSQLMIFVNEAVAWEKLPRKTIEKFLKLLAPFAPHLAEEIWREKLGYKNSIHREPWPDFDEKLTVAETITLAISVNGKLRDTLEVTAGISKADALAAAKKSTKIEKWLAGKKIKKEIFVPGKLVNFVV